MKNNALPSLQKAVYFLLFMILFFYAIIIAKQVLIPLSLGFLFATLIYPLSNWFESRLRIPKNLAILLSVLLFVGIFLVIINVMLSQFYRLVDDFPLLKQKALENLDYLKEKIEASIGIDSEVQHRWLKERIDHMFETGSVFLKNTVKATTGTAFVLLIIPVLMFYMLSFRDQFRKFIVMVVPQGRKIRTIRIMRQVTNVIQKYITGVFTVILILCVLNSLGLYIIGVKYAIIFGVISAFFNIIPYFGNWIGASIPFVFALLTGDSPKLGISVIIVYIIIQFIEHNILTPNITGGYVRLNPLATIVGIIVGGLVWGVAGMLIVIPFMATLKIVMDNYENLKPYAYLLSNTNSEIISIRLPKSWRMRRKKYSGRTRQDSLN